MIPVLFIAYYFPPAGGAGVQRSQKFVRYLPAEGFLPIVITGPWPSGSRWTPSDAALADEISADVKVLRAEGPIPKGGNLWGDRLNRWIGTTDPFSKWWVQSGSKAALQGINSAQIIFATMSPFSTADLAHKVSQRTGIPWIADLRDPWALDEMQIYPSRLHRIAEMHRMRRLLSSASGVIMNTPESTAVLRGVFPEFEAKRVTTITNGYDAPDFECEIPPRTDGKFRIVHTGYLHTDAGLELKQKRKFYHLLGGIEGGVDILTRSHVYLLKAVEQWLSRDSNVARDLEIVFAGVTSEQDKAAVANSKLAQFIKLPGYLSHLESVRLVRTADLLFLPMHNLERGRRSRIVPGKTYEYMASGQPILAAVPEGDAKDFLQQTGTAFITRPDDSDGMVRELDRVYSAWRQGVTVARPDRGFIRKFDRVNLTKDLAALFREVLQDAPIR